MTILLLVKELVLNKIQWVSKTMFYFSRAGTYGQISQKLHVALYKRDQYPPCLKKKAQEVIYGCMQYVCRDLRLIVGFEVS